MAQAGLHNVSSLKMQDPSAYAVFAQVMFAMDGQNQIPKHLTIFPVRKLQHASWSTSSFEYVQPGRKPKPYWPTTFSSNGVVN